MIRDRSEFVWAGLRRLSYLMAAVLLTACGGGNNDDTAPAPAPTPAPTPTPTPTPTPPTPFSMSRLVTDGSMAAATTDTHLINPWGIVFAPGAPVWLANNGTQSSTLYDGTGRQQALVVTIPPGLNGNADPTGIVFNGSTTDFLISNGTTSAAARFIFNGEGGTITGWAPSVNPTTAIIAYDDGTGGAIYKGLAIASENGVNRLYAADFHGNKVDVFDKDFKKVTVTGGFTDSTLPAGYGPFGIQALPVAGTARIFVSYAQHQTGSDEELGGTGLGLVNVFDLQGTLVTRLIPVGGRLNAPWGMALAPANFGDLSDTLLVGNFGDGIINGFNLTTGAFVAAIADSTGQPIASPGLWGIAFGNGARNQPATTLYFAAGVGGETGGLYGRIDLGATAPDIVAPTVALSAPAASATVSGATPVTATATDNTAVASVEFFGGTTSLGKVTAAPFTVSWDTTTAANGAVSLTAVALDAAGNSTTSAAVSVTVSNVAAPAAATLTELQTKYFGPICSGCHTGVGGALPGVMNLSSAASSFAALVNVASIERPALMRVKPSDSANSYLVNKLRGVDITGSQMPLGGTPLTAEQIAEVTSWIDAGAANN
jgi:uncharacterized protein (TIGR03118 family)